MDYEQTDFEEFIPATVKQRVCKQFVHKAGQNAEPGDRPCHCGYLESQHEPEALAAEDPDTKDWSVYKHTETQPTTAFGDIEFLGYGQKMSKFVRIDHSSDESRILKLMLEVWKLQRPNLLISVTGGAKNFHMRPRLKEVFNRGLMKAAATTGAWIITGGMHAGVMKHVGQAVQDYVTAHGMKDNITVIGIAPWGCVHNKECLIDPEGSWPAYYRVEMPKTFQKSPIDSNHSHFILVDNGTQNMFGTEIAFRAKLERAISQMKTRGEDNVSVPAVCVVLEGGPGTLETVKSAIQNGTPAVIVEGSGRAADILAFAYANSREEEVEVTDAHGIDHKKSVTIVTDEIWEAVARRIESEFGSRGLEEKLSWVKECMEYRDHVTIFRLDSKDTKDIDVAILRALFKVNKNESTDQLRLALAWNRIDVAKSDIFTEEKKWAPEILNTMMYFALLHNQVDFVRLFLDNGCNPRDFLTIRTLLLLYNNVPTNSQLHAFLMGQKKKKENVITLEEIGCLMRKMLGDFFNSNFLTDSRYMNLDTKRIIEDEAKPVVAKTTQNEHRVNTNSDKEEKEINGMQLPNMADSLNAPDRLSMCSALYGIQREEEKEQPDFDEPCLEIFIWCVLLNRTEMAKVFMTEGSEACAAALLAQKLLKYMLERTVDSELIQSLNASLEYFLNESVGIIAQCYTSDEKKTRILLVREMPNVGNSTVLQMAVKADAKEFIAHSAVQALLTTIWRGKMALDVSGLRIFICIFVPPLLSVLIKFRADDRRRLKVTSNRRKRTRQRRIQDVHELMQTSQKPNKSGRPLAGTVGDECEEESGEHLAWWKRIGDFYNAAIVTFLTNNMSYAALLLYYSAILLTEFHRKWTVHDIILVFWIHALYTDEIRQVIAVDSASVFNKIKGYLQDVSVWNLMDVLSVLTFDAGLILRSISEETCADCFKAARIVLAMNLMMMWFRTLQTYSIFKNLGPKLVMIGRMMIDLGYFMVILMVFVLAYGLAAQVILYPNAKLEPELLSSILHNPYFHMYGKFFLDEIEDTDDCSFLPEEYNNGIQRCPDDTTVVPILLACYILIMNVMMLNLLIAMFSFTFNAIQENTDQHWCFQRLFLCKEYQERPALAPPLILLSHLYVLTRKALNRCGCLKYHRDDPFLIKLTEAEVKQLVLWEKLNVEEFHRQMRIKEAASVESRIRNANERLDALVTQLDEMSESSPLLLSSVSAGYQAVTKFPPALDERVTIVEDQMKRNATALDWIISSMQESGIGAKRGPPKLVDVNKIREETAARRKLQADREKEQYQQLFLKQLELHTKSRSSHYPCSYQAVVRFLVPNAKVSWDEPWDDYEPVNHTDRVVLAGPAWADPIDLMDYDDDHRPAPYQFNAMDEKYGVVRISHHGHYQVLHNLPINPKGRTGLVGRGLLGRWGPNHACDPIVTRWCQKSGTVLMENGKRVIEFLAVYRSDCQKWAIPGGMMHPGRSLTECMKMELSKDALGTPVDVAGTTTNVGTNLDAIFENGSEVYRGYSDDHRNTDNAWVETVAVNYHDEEGTLSRAIQLRAGTEVEMVRWMSILSRQSLYGGHLAILQKVAKLHDAAF